MSSSSQHYFHPPYPPAVSVYQSSFPHHHHQQTSQLSSAAAAEAAAVAAGLPTPSLPPLSQLLPSSSTTILTHQQPDPHTLSTTTFPISHHYALGQETHNVQAQPNPIIPSTVLPVALHHLPSPPQSCADNVAHANSAGAGAAGAATTSQPSSTSAATTSSSSSAAAAMTTATAVAAAAAAASTSASASEAAQKTFSFVPLPGINHKKRPRRKYHEVERLYHCNYPGCTKAYGTLNHLNAHVSMQNHVSLGSPGFLF